MTLNVLARHALGSLVILAMYGASVATAQQTDERRLWDTEFIKKRPAAKTAAPARKAPAYRRATPTPADAVDKTPGEMLGVTIWKLRRSRANDDTDARLLLQEDADSDRAEWTPERVEVQTTFSAGDRVRLSIESPRDGYLYVVDREQYADGTISDPYLIFPTLRILGGNNSVGAGRVIELPEKRAFVLKPMRADYKGELLTLLVTATPLADIIVKPTNQKIEAGLLDDWTRQWASTVERFEMVDGAGKSYTKEEKEAGTEGRLLTQEDELPQTLFRVVTQPGAPVLVTVPLKIDR